MINVLSFASSLQWDPQIRGMLFVFLGATVLIGSVLLLVSTNTGFRMGLWIVVTVLAGWMMILTSVWTVYALKQGPPNPSTHEAKWVVREIITPQGNGQTLENLSGYGATADFAEHGAQSLNGWQILPADDKDRADTVSATDNALAPAPPAEGAHETTPAEPTFKGTSPFSSTSDYIVVGAWFKGGQTYWPLGVGVRSLHDDRNKGRVEVSCAQDSPPSTCKNENALIDCKDGSGKNCVEGAPFHWWQRAYYRMTKGFLHEPHYAVIQVQPVVPVDTDSLPLGATPPAPKADTSQPITTIVMVRELGTQRVLPFVWLVGAVVIFAILAYGLHRRDKAVWRLRDAQVANA